MKEADDDLKIQELLDQKMRGLDPLNPEIDPKDLVAYEILYQDLKTDHSSGPSLSFKSNLLRRIKTEKKQADDTKFYLLLAFAILSGIIAVTFLALVYQDALAPAFRIIDQHMGMIAIAIVAILAFNYMEYNNTRRERIY